MPIIPSQILDKSRFWEEMKTAANDTYLYAGGADHYKRYGKSAQHAYAVLQVAEHGDLKLLKMRDPWGEHQENGPWTYRFTEWTSELVSKLGDDFKDPGVSHALWSGHLFAIGVELTRGCLSGVLDHL